MRPPRCSGWGGFSFLWLGTVAEDAAIGGPGSGPKAGSPGIGRPRGSRRTLLQGELAAVDALKRQIAETPGDELAKWATQKLIDIASGLKSHRHVGSELAAIRDILDRREGRPTEKVQHSGEIRHRVEIVDDADGEG